jgi:hypothetical protein
VIRSNEDGTYTEAIKNQIGPVTFDFDPVFTLQGTDNESVEIGINKLSSPADSEIDAFKASYGIISGADYIRFSNAAEQSVSYSETIKQDSSGAYELGKISFGSASGTPIYGTHNTYTASVEPIK